MPENKLFCFFCVLFEISVTFVSVNLKLNIMKKVLLFALAGIMMLAFTQCGGSKGSKEFQDNKELMTNLEKAVKQAKTCDELQTAVFTVAMSALANADKEYADNEKMTDKEKETVEKLGKEIEDLMTKKGEELGCKDDDSLFGDFEDDVEDFTEDVEEFVEDAVEE